MQWPVETPSQVDIAGHDIPAYLHFGELCKNHCQSLDLRYHFIPTSDDKKTTSAEIPSVGSLVVTRWKSQSSQAAV